MCRYPSLYWWEFLSHNFFEFNMLRLTRHLFSDENMTNHQLIKNSSLKKIQSYNSFKCNIHIELILSTNHIYISKEQCAKFDINKIMFTWGIWKNCKKRAFDCLSIAAKGTHYTRTINLNARLKKVKFSQKLELINFN